MRLDKFLSERTPHTRSTIKKLISSRKITVNGSSAVKADMNVSESDVITVEGTTVRTQRTLTLLMNKPSGFVSATEDKTEKTVIDLLPEEYQNQNLAPAGRLDKDTTGSLIPLLCRIIFIPGGYRANRPPLTNFFVTLVSFASTNSFSVIEQPARTEERSSGGKFPKSSIGISAR